jgi:hypothetical protein
MVGRNQDDDNKDIQEDQFVGNQVVNTGDGDQDQECAGRFARFHQVSLEGFYSGEVLPIKIKGFKHCEDKFR